MKLLPVLLLLLATLGCKQISDQKPAASNTPNVPPMRIDAKTLISDYRANEVSADETYRGKLLEVHGVVDRVSDIGGTTHVSLKGDGGGLLTVDCSFTDYDPHVRGLRADIPATLYGVGDGMTLNLYVGLTECRVK